MGLDSPTITQVPGDATNAGSPRHITVTADFTSGTWNTAAAHEILTVTGLNRVKIIARVEGTVTDTTDTGTLVLGTETTSNAYISSTDTDDLADGELWYDATPTTKTDTTATAMLDVVVNDDDIGYTIGGEALTGGSIVFECYWYPLEVGASVLAGAGGAL